MFENVKMYPHPAQQYKKRRKKYHLTVTLFKRKVENYFFLEN
jgi:hypothetical protein